MKKAIASAFAPRNPHAAATREWHVRRGPGAKQRRIADLNDACGNSTLEQPVQARYLRCMTEKTDFLDTIGLLCPLPVLKARKRLQSMAPGADLRIHADDPAAQVDVPHFCAEQGHVLISQTDLPGGVLEFVVRKKS